MFKIAVEHEFVVRPSQELEGRMDRLFDDLGWHSDRRNEVAHSVIYNVQALSSIKSILLEPDRTNYVALPPLYALRKHGDDGLPNYAYSSVELTALERSMFEVLLEVRRFRHEMHPELWPTEVRA